MNNLQFFVIYNGKRTEVAMLDENTYSVQITYKPVIIHHLSKDGKDFWLDDQTHQETSVTRELGKLILEYLKRES